MNKTCYFDFVSQDGTPLQSASGPVVPRVGDKVYFKGSFPDAFTSGYGKVTEVVWQVHMPGEGTPTAHAFVTLRIGKSWVTKIVERVDLLHRLRQARVKSQQEYEEAHAR
jgi:hypothetical protein